MDRINPPAAHAPREDLRRVQARWDAEAAAQRFGLLRAIARRDPVLAEMIAEDLRWMPAVFAGVFLLVLIAAVMAP